MAEKIKRTPLNYESKVAYDQGNIDVVLQNPEFAQFLVGAKSEVSGEVRTRIKEAMKGQSAKMGLFLAAYAQKNMNRIARILSALDIVDGTLLQEWRIRSMDTEELVALFGEMNNEKARSIKEMVTLVEKFDGEKSSDRLFGTDDEAEELSPQSKLKMLKFFKEKIMVKDKK